MIRNLKFLGLALVAAFAMSVVAVSAASAQQFHAESAPMTLTGTQEGQDVFTTDGGTVECTTATYKGEQKEVTTATARVAPTYGGCTAFGGFANAEILMNGCEYLFHVTQNGSNTGTVDIACTGSNEITVVAKSFGTVKCTAHIPAQTGKGPIHFTNVGAGTTREITVDVNIATGITYTQTAGSGFGACANATDTSNGKYTGKAIVTGETKEEKEIETEKGKKIKEYVHVGVWIE